MLQIMADKLVLVYTHLQSYRASLIARGCAEFLGHGQHTLDAADRALFLPIMESTAEGADVSTGLLGAPQQLMNLEGSARGTILFRNAIPSPFLHHMLAQELAGLGIEHTNEQAIPLHFDRASDPTRRGAVIGSVDFHAAIQVHGAIAELVITERLQEQRPQRRLLCGKHGRDLSLGGAVNPGIGPMSFPVIQANLTV